MKNIVYVDTNRGSISSHTIEARVGFDTVARAMLEQRGREWYVYDVYTKPEYRKQGISRDIISHIEEGYGPIIFESENDPFWEKMGYARHDDGFWRKTN